MKIWFFLSGALICSATIILSQSEKIKLLQEDVIAHPLDRVSLYNLGVEAVKQRDFEQARAAFSCAKTVADPRPLDALYGEQLFYNAGNVEMKLADYAAAEKSFDTVLHYNPSNDKARKKRDLARQLKEQKKQEASNDHHEDHDSAPKDEQKEHPGKQGSPQENHSSMPEKKDAEGNKQEQKEQGSDRKKQGGGQSQPQQQEDKRADDKSAQKTEQKKGGGVEAEQPASASEKKEDPSEQGGWGGAEKNLTERDQALLHHVDQVDRANAKNWMRLQTQQMGGDYEQHKW